MQTRKVLWYVLLLALSFAAGGAYAQFSDSCLERPWSEYFSEIDALQEAAIAETPKELASIPRASTSVTIVISDGTGAEYLVPELAGLRFLRIEGRADDIAKFLEANSALDCETICLKTQGIGASLCAELETRKKLEYLSLITRDKELFARADAPLHLCKLKSLTVSSDSLSNNTLKKISRLSGLSALRLESISVGTEAVVQHICRLPLVALDLGGASVLRDDLMLVRNITSLRCLSLPDADMDRAGILAIVSKLPRLEHLDTYGFELPLAQVLQKSTTLQSVTHSGGPCDIAEDPAGGKIVESLRLIMLDAVPVTSDILKFLSERKVLEQVVYRGCTWVNGTIPPPSPPISLRVVELRDATNLPESYLRSLSNASFLKVLRIENTTFDEWDPVPALNNLDELQVLRVAGCRGVDGVRLALLEIPTLLTLELVRLRNVSDDTIVCITSQCPNLKRLSFQGLNSITTQGAKDVLRSSGVVVLFTHDCAKLESIPLRAYAATLDRVVVIVEP